MTSINQDGQYLYYNARLSNYQYPGEPNTPLACIFQDDRPAPLIGKANEWKMSIVRFQTTLQTIPALLVEHPLQAGNQPTNTSYIWTFESGATTFTANTQWTPAVSSLLQTTGDEYSDPYWQLENGGYLRFIGLVNNTFTGLNTQLITAGVLPAGTAAPYWSFNSMTGIISLNVPTAYVSNNVAIKANINARYLFKGFGEQLLPSGDYQYVFYTYNTSPVNGVYTWSQLPGGLTTWNPVRRIVFTTSLLPVQPEAVVPQENYATGVVPSSNTTEIVISDLTPQVSTGLEFSSGTLDYSPTAQYRWVSLAGNSGISQIQFQVSWEDALGSLHTHILSHNGFLSAKICFQKIK